MGQVHKTEHIQSFISQSQPLKEPGWKYYIKTAIATSLLAAPGFIDATRPFFNKYRGEWALLSFFVVIAPTEGHVSSSPPRFTYWSQLTYLQTHAVIRERCLGTM